MRVGPEATQLIERVLDVAADMTGIDPAEIRRINFIPKFSQPMTTSTGGNYDSGDYEAALDAVLKASDYSSLRHRRRWLRRSVSNRVGCGSFARGSVAASAGWCLRRAPSRSTRSSRARGTAAARQA